MKHTKTPWTHNNYGELIGSDGEQVVVSALGIAHSCVGLAVGRANSDFIVRAVNNHDALCELLHACAMQLSIEDGATRRMDGILAKRAFDLLEGME